MDDYEYEIKIIFIDKSYQVIKKIDVSRACDFIENLIINKNGFYYGNTWHPYHTILKIYASKDLYDIAFLRAQKRREGIMK